MQHNSIWTKLFNFDASKTRKIIQFKLRRLLYEEIKSIRRVPTFKNARYLGYCLNISGMTIGPHKAADGEYVFRKAVISWARKNYLWMVDKNPKVANAALIARLSFDPDKRRLVKTYEEGLREEAPREFLDLDPPPPKKEPAKNKNPPDRPARNNRSNLHSIRAVLEKHITRLLHLRQSSL